jgi:hypothetical protein
MQRATDSWEPARQRSRLLHPFRHLLFVEALLVDVHVAHVLVLADAGGNRLQRRFRSTCETLVGLDFEGYTRDRRRLIKELRRCLKKVASTPLDMYVLHGNHGLHELRRQLRWLPICAVSLEGWSSPATSTTPSRNIDPS